METGDSAPRQSGISSASNQDTRYDQRQQQLPPPPSNPRASPREAPSRSFSRDSSTMATATLINPSTPYHGHHPAFSQPYPPHASAGPSIAGLMSPVEPRRPSDDAESSQRQSLPSISEVISNVKPSPYPASAPTSAPTFPSPFPPSSRPFADAASEAHSSPQPLHPAPPGFPARQEPLPPFSGSPRAPFAASSRPPPGPPGAPISSFIPPHPSPPRIDAEPKHAEASHHPNGSYPPHPTPPHGQLGQHGQYPSVSLPPGQLPLPPYGGPISPRHLGAPAAGPQEQQRPHGEDNEYPRRYDHSTVNRHIEAWGYQESLTRIASSSRTIYNFAESYSKLAQEQHTAHPIPERLPTDKEVADMLNNVDFLRKSLEQLRDMVQVSLMSSERLRDGGKSKGPYDEDSDVSMYDGSKSFGLAETKKRRGRAAPPGRCHSCNRIDTPEWRRGPDGARTLCNACGLHYAKLERKRQHDSRALRPKPADE